ncbi:hypothetical protein NHX12_025248 [Muraenolepis orangiensis]|uniref:Peptidase M12B propeptide domain-containing protein n=1 Tax=Muraenolepis orangiensis TaxID=630683 RepID=A0A9Q0EKU8_9TELE|nr:hypothetical protein NHX12_025248 [Muraenolepis orangiensis]
MPDCFFEEKRAFLIHFSSIAMDCMYLWMYSLLAVLLLDHTHAAESHEKLSGKLSEYGLIVPFSTDALGRYVSHVVSASSGDEDGGATAAASAAPPSGTGGRRVARSAPGTPRPPASSVTLAGHRLFFNVTVFGTELHLRLRANRRLVAPGAFVEWQEDFEQLTKEPIHGDCVFTGDVTDMPEASVAISNCDGLVSE